MYAYVCGSIAGTSIRGVRACANEFMHAFSARGSVACAWGSRARNSDPGRPNDCVTGGEDMSRNLRWCALAVVMTFVVAACGGDTEGSTTTAGGGDTTTAAAGPSTTGGGETTTTAPSELVTDCDTSVRSEDASAMEMWERTGGNSGMVDALVCAWNDRNPDRFINLTYIEHTEMVAKLAQGIASGDVPDLMGLDLIYGPQFTSAGQLQDITDLIGDDPNLATASQGH